MTRGRAGSRRGAAIVEASLILPLFLVFWFGIVDWGITYWVHETIVHNTNLAARRAIVNTWDATATRNMVVYGNAAGSGTRLFGLSAAGTDAGPGTNVDVTLKCLTTMTPSLQQGTTCLDAAWAQSPRWIEIVVHDYRWAHFTPFFSGSYTGRPVTVSLPTESLGVS